MSTRLDDLHKLRREYLRSRLNESEFTEEPMQHAKAWLEEAIQQKLPEPNAMLLSTVSSLGHPSSRTVLLKEMSQEGCMFFSNYDSQKAEEMIHQPRVALLFLWIEMERQLRIEGKAERVAEEVSDLYFSRRPRGSQLSTWASEQSRPLSNRQQLEAQLQHQRDRFATHSQIPRPPNWGGYLVRPYVVEFWQGRDNRLHDRIHYHREEHKSWKKTYLSP